MRAAAASLVTGAGVVVLLMALAAVVLRPHHGSEALASRVGLALDLFVGAGLIRLSGLDDLKALSVVASIIAIRKVLMLGLRLGARSLALDGTSDAGA